MRTQGIDLLVSLQLHGVLRVILEPLIGDLPIVGAVSMFFIKRPVRGGGIVGRWETWDCGVWEERRFRQVAMDIERSDQRLALPMLPRSCPDSSVLLFQTLDINWTGMTNLLDIPGLRYWAPSQVSLGRGFRDTKQDTSLCARVLALGEIGCKLQERFRLGFFSPVGGTCTLVGNGDSSVGRSACCQA